ncbi:MAG: hypothetical protein MUO24_02390 [Desulfobacterales bacterium]|nr:hypothetical protein [Desulfobacterales bacterium]
MPDPKSKRTCGGNPNPSPDTRFKPGNPIRGGRQPLQRREGDNRHTVLDACHQIAMMLQGTELKEAELKKKTRLWVMLYRLSIKDPKTFLGYYAGMPRQAVDLDATNAGPIPILVTYVNRQNRIDGPASGADAKTA